VIARPLFLLLLLAAPARADWEKFSDSDGVLVEWRKVSGMPNREIRATGTIAQPLDKLVTALRDLEHYPEFMPPTEAVEINWAQGERRHIHVTIKPPWVSRRDYCLEMIWTRTATAAFSRWFQIPECPPPKKGVVRHVRTEGTWNLHAVDAGHTFVEYQSICDPGGAIPSWMVDRGTAKTMIGMYQALARRAATLP
jgi:hypothetical protein